MTFFLVWGACSVITLTLFVSHEKKIRFDSVRTALVFGPFICFVSFCLLIAHLSGAMIWKD